MDKDTEKILLYGGIAAAVYFLFIKKPATSPVMITSGSTGVTSLANGQNVLSSATNPLTSLITSISKAFTPAAPAPPAGGTQGAGATQLVSADPDGFGLPTTSQDWASLTSGSPFASPANGGAVVQPAPVPVNNSIYSTQPIFATSVPGLDSTGGSVLSYEDMTDDDPFSSLGVLSGMGGL